MKEFLNTFAEKVRTYSIKLAGEVRKRKLLVIGFLILVIAGLYFSNGYFFNKTVANNQPVLSPPISKTSINNELIFPIKDSEQNEIGKVRFLIESAEKRADIYVKGKLAKPVKGKQFLILNIKLVNEFDQGVRVNTRDFIRLTVNNQEEKIAPTIHNDPIEVQAISTQPTKLGFVVSEKDKPLTLYFGEISGEKKKIEISFP